MYRIGTVAVVTFGDGATLPSVLCPGRDPYWFAVASHDRVYSDFAEHRSSKIVAVEPHTLSEDEAHRLVATYAYHARAKVAAGVDVRQAQASAWWRDGDDGPEDLGSDPADYAQYVTVLAALAARFQENPPADALPLPGE